MVHLHPPHSYAYINWILPQLQKDLTSTRIFVRNLELFFLRDRFTSQMH